MCLEEDYYVFEGTGNYKASPVSVSLFIDALLSLDCSQKTLNT